MAKILFAYFVLFAYRMIFIIQDIVKMSVT